MAANSPILAAQPAPSTEAGYTARFEKVVWVRGEVVNALSDAALDSACLSDANFELAVSNLSEEERVTALRFRELGADTLNETQAWNTCGNQVEQSQRLRMAWSSAASWNHALGLARQSAKLADHEEVRDGILVDKHSGEPVNSEVQLARSFVALLVDSRWSGGPFEATLLVSQNGYVTDCQVVRSSGSSFLDRRVCRRALLPRINRPAFANGRPTTSNIPLRIGVNSPSNEAVE